MVQHFKPVGSLRFQFLFRESLCTPYPVEQCLFLEEDQFARRLEVRQRVRPRQFVERTLGNAEERRGFLQVQHFLCRIAKIFQSLDSFMQSHNPALVFKIHLLWFCLIHIIVF